MPPQIKSIIYSCQDENMCEHDSFKELDHAIEYAEKENDNIVRIEQMVEYHPDDALVWTRDGGKIDGAGISH